MLRLVTIPISHYCEKARWGLQRAGVPYREERHVQGIHRVAARRAGGGQTVPVLVTPEGSLGESEQILRWVDERTSPERRLFPDEAAELIEVERLSRRFDERLGPRGRRFMYVKMLAHRELTLRVNNQGVPRWEDRALRLGWPFAVRFLGHALGIRPGIEVEDERVVWGSSTSSASCSRTVARICAATASAPPTSPSPPCRRPSWRRPCMPWRCRSRTRCRPEMADFVNRVRDHPAGRYALALYDARGG